MLPNPRATPAVCADRKSQTKHTVDRLNPSKCDFAALISEFSGSQSSFLCSGRFTAGWPSTGGNRDLLIGRLPRTNPNVFQLFVAGVDDQTSLKYVKR